LRGGLLFGFFAFLPYVGHSQPAPSAPPAAVAPERPTAQPSDDSDPQSRLWRIVKQMLSGPRAEQTFEESVKDVLLPGGVNGLKAFEGTLVSSTPAGHPHEFLVTMLNEKTPEVTLKLHGELEQPLPPGTRVTFEGVVKGFKAEPCMVTFEVETVNRAVMPGRPAGNQKSK